jgi:hypothetical protein
LSAYQMGCEALVALGHAEATSYGARPRDAPQLPDRPPRWDDVCCAVLTLAAQNGLLRYVGPEGFTYSMPSTAGRTAAIGSAHGLGPAVSTSEIISVLELLSLIDDGRWTAEAELVLWREQPREWRMDISADPRFLEAVAVAAGTMPVEIRRTFDRLTTITEVEVREQVERAGQTRTEHAWRGLTFVSAPAPKSAAEALERIALVRSGELDWLFFRHWRLDTGWLAPGQTTCTLAIFHDPLAVAVRKGVVALIAPDARAFLA